MTRLGPRQNNKKDKSSLLKTHTPDAVFQTKIKKETRDRKEEIKCCKKANRDRDKQAVTEWETTRMFLLNQWAQDQAQTMCSIWGWGCSKRNCLPRKERNPLVMYKMPIAGDSVAWAEGRVRNPKKILHKKQPCQGTLWYASTPLELRN